MTFYEHAMIGIDGALALGLPRRYGWGIVALAGFAAILPDADGLTLLLGPAAYALGHRAWGHNLLVAGLFGMATGAIAWRLNLFGRARRCLTRHWTALQIDLPSPKATPGRREQVLVWIAVGVAAAYSHLAADCLFSSGAGLGNWELPLLWPFTHTMFALPMVPWGDVGTTLILILGMFAMVRWPTRWQTIAWCALAMATAYIVLRGLCC